MRPTRGFTCIGPGQPYPPIWPCSTRGFPCLRCRHRSGGLLPHRFTLACASLNWPAEGFASCRPPSEILTGGFVSVALSVAESSRIQPPGVTRRVALHPEKAPEERSKGISESGLSSSALTVQQRASDHPTRPLGLLY